MPSTIDQDLGRRDFTVNAMAVEVASGAFGLIDRHGGRADLEAKRLTILHPASFVEDPTRMFRAARYAARLGLRMDAWTRRCQAWALSLVPYPALSGVRILAELGHVLREPRPELVLVRLGVDGVYRLLDPRYRFTKAARAAVLALPETLAWARANGVDVPAVELALVAVLAGQPSDVPAAALARLALSGEPLARVSRALGAGPALMRAVEAAPRASDRARLLRGRSALEHAWLALNGAGAHVTWFRDADAVRGHLRGDDVIALGVPPGREVAAVLDALRDARLDGGVMERGAEESFVRAWTNRKER